MLKVIGWILLVLICLNLLFIIITSLLLSVKLTLGLDVGESGTRFRLKWGFFKLRVYPELFEPEKKAKIKAFIDKKKDKFGPLIDKIKARRERKKAKKKGTKEPKEKLTFDEVLEKIKNFDFEGAYAKAKSIYQKLGSFGGILELLKYIALKTKDMSLKLLKVFTIKELYIDFIVAGDDASKTAIKYGKTCAVAFPALGTICTNMKVRQYDLDINPDFLANKNTGDLHTVVSFRPIRLAMILLGYGLKILNKVLFRILFSHSENSTNTDDKQKTKIEIGGA